MADSTTRILGYADPLSVAPGDRLELKLSCTDVESFRLDFVRIVCGDPDPRGPGLHLEPAASPVDGEYRGRFKPIDVGSYVRVEGPFGLQDDSRFAVAALIWPTAPFGRRQTVMGWWSEPEASGFALEIGESGELRLRLGTGAGVTDAACAGALLERRWYFVAASFTPESRAARAHWFALEACVGSAPRASASLDEASWRAPPADTPFLIGAHRAAPSHGRWMSGGHYNGKVERPMLLGASPEFDRLRAVARDPATATPADRLLAAWDFSDGIEGRTVLDRGPHARHGHTVNLPARGVTGHSWDGSVADWRHAPGQYGAIHFHEDDLHDCRWSSDVAFEIPGDWKSGFYAARMRAPGSVGYVAFFVRPRRGAAGAHIALVASTATYMSYANTHIKFDSLNTENLYESLTPISEDELYLNEHRELGLSHYDTHSDGSGVFYASRLRPMLNFRPGLYTFNYLKRHPYRRVAGGARIRVRRDHRRGHPRGRRGLCCPAIGSWSRVPIRSTPPPRCGTPSTPTSAPAGATCTLGATGSTGASHTARRSRASSRNRRGITGVRTWEGEPGEHHLSFTGEPGGLWRSNRRPPQRLVGVGFSATLFDRSTHYRRTAASLDPRFAFVFEGIGDEERIGDFGLRGGGAAGMELDRWDAALGAPPNCVVLATSEDVGIGGLLTVEEFVTTTRALDGAQNGRVRADMVFFETPGGGGGVVHRLHRLGDLARLQRVRQQRLAHHRECASAISGPAPVRGASMSRRCATVAARASSAGRSTRRNAWCKTTEGSCGSSHQGHGMSAGVVAGGDRWSPPARPVNARAGPRYGTGGAARGRTRSRGAFRS